MTKTILTTALAAMLIAPLGLATAVHATGTSNVQTARSDVHGQPSKCDNITDPVKKQQCIKQESGQR